MFYNIFHLIPSLPNTPSYFVKFPSIPHLFQPIIPITPITPITLDYSSLLCGWGVVDHTRLKLRRWGGVIGAAERAGRQYPRFGAA